MQMSSTSSSSSCAQQQQVPELLAGVCPLLTIPDGYVNVRTEDLVAVNTALHKLGELAPSRVGGEPGIRIRADDRRACIVITLIGCSEPIDASRYAEFAEFPRFCDAYITMQGDVAELVVELYTTRHPDHGKRDSVPTVSDARVLDVMAERSAAALQSVIAEANNVAALTRK